MSAPARPFHLAWFSWHGAQDWASPAWGATEWTTARPYLDTAMALEQRGGFDMVIFADSSAINNVYGGSIDTYVRYGLEGLLHDPVPLMTMMASATRHLGVVATMNTSLFPPHLLARQLATIDHLTGGRVGWNIVTGVRRNAADNYGITLDVPHDERYDVAEDYVALCRELWDSWSGDALDPLTGAPDPARVRSPRFDGKYFSADGALSLPRMPQGHPLLLQAGGSPRGRDFAAGTADVVISHQNTVEDMREFRADIRARAAAAGRDPDSVKVFFTVKPIVGESAEDAAAVRDALYADPSITIESGLAQFSYRVGQDFSGYDIDQPVDQAGLANQSGSSTSGNSLSMFRQYYRDGRAPTLREVARRESIKETLTVQGDPATVAAELADLMAAVGGDGLAIRGALVPAQVSTFVDRVVPELRRLGAVRDHYEEGTLRDNVLAF